MATNGPDPNSPKAGGLWGRLFGMNQPRKPDPNPETTRELPPANGEPTAVANPAPVAQADVASKEVAVEAATPGPQPQSNAASQKAPPTLPSLELDAALEPEPAPALAVAEAPATAAPSARPMPAKPQAAAPAMPPVAVPAAGQSCPICGTARQEAQPYCNDCGYMFKPADAQSAGASAAMSSPSSANGERIKDRYEIVDAVGERAGVARFRGIDHESGQWVIIVRGALPEMAEALLLDEETPTAELTEDDFMPGFDTPALPVAQVSGPAAGPAWPSVAWELALLEKARHPALPGIVENFADGSYEYLIEEGPQGRILWDAWDDPDNDSSVRYGFLMQIAQGLDALHKAGAIIEGIRPDIVTVTDSGQAMIADLSDLLPIPVPPGTPLRATLYTAPELITNPEHADARADLYSFGAMLYSLEYLHHALEEKDFESQYSPRLITDRYPDVHPGFFRLVCKTFTRDLNTRFPTDEAAKEDATGFTELGRTLDVCRRSFENCRLDIAAWTTTGMVRTGNEDAFAFLQAVESRQDELTEYAMVLLADGMGGYEAGEVAAALCIAALRTFLLQQPMFSSVAGKEAPAPGVFSPEACRKVMEQSLRYANKEVYTASRTPGKGRRGMGCTAEAVYVDSRNLVVGHVGDSRTYHMSNGRLKQLTRDQTFVNRMVELGQLTEEEAEEHPRKNELQQAIGGQPDVVPGLYSAKLNRGDWVIVCSDGLTNHVPTRDLEQMMRETYGSAEETARRLLNLVNLRGATDNATVVVIRAV